MTDGWDTVERPPLPEPWDIKESPVTGVFIETKTIKTKDQFNGEGTRMSTYHVIRETATGALCGVWGSPDLDGKMEQVTAGDDVRIEYLETSSLPNGRSIKLYDVKKRTAGANAAGPSHPTATATGTDDDIPF